MDYDTAVADWAVMTLIEQISDSNVLHKKVLQTVRDRMETGMLDLDARIEESAEILANEYFQELLRVIEDS